MLVFLALLLGAALAAWGVHVDGSRPVEQFALFGALQVASLGGAALGTAIAWPRMSSARQRGALVLATAIGWRLSYFPIMVFSGHVASIAEWFEVAIGMRVFVYPIFLLNVAILHAVAAVGASWLLRPPHRLVYAVLVPAFSVATAVSFSSAEDLRLLPDRVWRLEDPVPRQSRAVANPYLPALFEPGYAPQQRVMLLAAGLTYETIPDAPWARTVKGVLEGQFHDNPHASTADRVREHYLAYHSAHSLIGCATDASGGCYSPDRASGVSAGEPDPPAPR